MSQNTFEIFHTYPMKLTIELSIATIQWKIRNLMCTQPYKVELSVSHRGGIHNDLNKPGSSQHFQLISLKVITDDFGP